MALESKGLATENSRIKMRVFTSNSVENKGWFSPVKENRKPTAEIIEGMRRRFLTKVAEGTVKINARINVIIFYDAYSGAEIERFKP